MSNHKFDEYKLFVGSTQHLSERRQAATQTYLSVNTAIFAILALLVKEAGLKGGTLVAVSLPLFLVGILACLIWHRIIMQYKALIGWRYDQLMAMERGMPESHQIYVKENKEFFKQEKKKFGFSRLEVWLPRLFLALYIVYATVLILAVAYTNIGGSAVSWRSSGTAESRGALGPSSYVKRDPGHDQRGSGKAPDEIAFR
jgi:hypothetical protein